MSKMNPCWKANKLLLFLLHQRPHSSTFPGCIYGGWSRAGNLSVWTAWLREQCHLVIILGEGKYNVSARANIPAPCFSSTWFNTETSIWFLLAFEDLWFLSSDSRFKNEINHFCMVRSCCLLPTCFPFKMALYSFCCPSGFCCFFYLRPPNWKWAKRSDWGARVLHWKHQLEPRSPAPGSRWGEHPSVHFCRSTLLSWGSISDGSRSQSAVTVLTPPSFSELFWTDLN